MPETNHSDASSVTIQVRLPRRTSTHQFLRTNFKPVCSSVMQAPVSLHSILARSHLPQWSWVHTWNLIKVCQTTRDWTCKNISIRIGWKAWNPVKWIQVQCQKLPGSKRSDIKEARSSALILETQKATTLAVVCVATWGQFPTSLQLTSQWCNKSVLGQSVTGVHQCNFGIMQKYSTQGLARWIQCAASFSLPWSVNALEWQNISWSLCQHPQYGGVVGMHDPQEMPSTIQTPKLLQRHVCSTLNCHDMYPLRTTNQ